MPRIPYLNASDVSEAGGALLEATGDSNLWRMFLHNPKLAHQIFGLGAGLLREGLLDPIHREIAILTVGRLRESAYEIHHHTIIARMLGFSEEKLSGTLDGSGSGLTPIELLVQAFAQEITIKGVASDATFAGLSEHYDVPRLIELCVVCGFYNMASAFLATFGVEIETNGKTIPNRMAHVQAAKERA